LRAWAQRARNQANAKAQAVLDWLTTHLKPNGEWNDRRVILFTEYRTTHQWMHQILASHGFGGERLGLLHGSLSQEEREPIKAAFQASPQDSPVRILLATDAASEGIDLQNHCNRLIHLEIPYNPNVMEQRNGRIDRHGWSKFPVCIAKTQYSFSDDPTAYGSVRDFDLEVRDVVINTGAEMIVLVLGALVRMPGLPRVPQAEKIDFIDGHIEGLS